MLIKDLCIINPKSINKNFQFINYIDTSSVVDGTLLEVQNLTNNYPSRAKRELVNDDILISSVRPNLKHNYYVHCNYKNLIGSTGFIQIRVNSNEVHPKYLYYFLTNEKQVKKYTSVAETSQTTFPSFNKDVIENIEFPNISYENQVHIVNTIGSIDNLIENLNKIKDKLHEFVSVRLKNEPSSIKLLGDYINIYDNIRKPLSSMERTGEKIYPYYGATGILDYVSNYIFDDEYVLLAEDGSVMNNEEKPIIQYINGKTWVGNHAHVLKATNGLTLYSLYFILKDTNVKNAVTGAVQMKINQSNLKKINIKLPIEIKKINKFTESVMNEIIIINNKLINLNNLKQQYLKKFFG